MSKSEIKNVLLLGTGSIKILQFCKLFEAYLQHDSYEDAIQWQPNLMQNEGDENPIIFANNLHLIYTPDMERSYVSKQILSILSKFEKGQRLNAIIILLKPNKTENDHLAKLRSHLFHDLKPFSGVILYVYALGDGFYKYQRIIKKQLDLLTIENNIFYFNEDTFFNASNRNWSEGVDFCKQLNNYIVGDENKNGLGSVYIHNGISTESLLNLINDLLQLLFLTYICTRIEHREVDDSQLNRKYINTVIYVSGYKRNVTVCHDNQCSKWITYSKSWRYEPTKLKIPKICHAPCKCFKVNGTNCSVFEGPNKTCIRCRCTTKFHSQIQFKCDYVTPDQCKQDNGCEIMRILSKFYIFKKQYDEIFNCEEIFSMFLDIQHTNSIDIFKHFMRNFNSCVENLSQSEPVTHKDIVECLNSLYEFQYNVKIIPQFLEEIFPQNTQFEIVTDEHKKAAQNTETKLKFETPEIVSDGMEMQVLKKKVESTMNKILNLRQNLPTEKGNVLDSNGNDGGMSSGSVVKLNSNKNTEEEDEKKINGNID